MDIEALVRTCLAHQQLSIDTLLSLTFPDDPFGRFLINQQLEQIHDPRAIDLLLARLGDDDPGVASSAAQALGLLREPRAHQPLLDLLASSHERTYYQQIDIGVVADAVVLTGADPIATLLRLFHTYPNDSVIGGHVISRLPQGDTIQIIDGLLEAIGSESDHVEEAATRRLAEIGRWSPEVLVSRIFEHHTPGWLDELEHSLKAVLRTAGPNVVPALVATAQASSSESALRVMLPALYAIGDVRAVPLYEQVRTHRDRLVRAYAIFGLAAAGDQRVFDDLLKEVGQGWGEYDLGRACAGLGSAIVPRLVRLLESSTASEQQREDVVSVLGMLHDPDAVPPLIIALSAETLSMRQSVVHALGDSHDPRAVGPLIRVLKDDQANIHQWAVVALYELGRHQVAKDEVVDALVEVMKNTQETPHVREQASMLLPSLGGEGLVTAFQEVFEEQDPKISVIISAGLADLGPRGISALIQYAQSGQEPLETSAYKRLCFVRDPAAEQVVIDGLHAPSPTRRKDAAMAIGRWRLEQGREPLMATLDDADEAVRLEVIRSLGIVGDERSLFRLMALRRERGEPAHETKVQVVNRALIAIYCRVSASSIATDETS
jgi:HEAT repeat protein